MMYIQRRRVKGSGPDYRKANLNSDDNWFGPRVKAFRERVGLSQLKLSEEMDVSLQTVRDWERGTKFPHLRRVPQLARVLGVEAGQFFPSTGYSPQWPQNAREDQNPFGIPPTPQVLEDIESHLALALSEFRKLRKNQVGPTT